MQNQFGGGGGSEEDEVEDDSKIVRSPFYEYAKNRAVPDVPLTSFVFESLKKNERAHGDNPLVIDAVRGQVILYKELEPLSMKFASALNRTGFQKGDVVFYVTYNAALIYVLFFGIWRCGGAVRGCYQREEKDEIVRQMRETKCRFVLCEQETAPVVKSAIEALGWPVKLLSIDGEVEGATPVEDMVYREDGSAYPNDTVINPKECIMCIPSTNGSTGPPKGALHTQHNMVAMLTGLGAPVNLERFAIPNQAMLSVMGNFTIGPFISFHVSIMFGQTFISISKFDKATFFDYIVKHRPARLFLFPYVANWFCRSPELDNHDLSYITGISAVGSVFDSATLAIMNERLPHAKVSLSYAMTETLIISSHNVGISKDTGRLMDLKVEKLEDEVHVSCGPLAPFVEAKIVDIETGKILGRKEKGEIFVRSPYLMKGYLKNREEGKKEFITPATDSEGWFDTGDVGFFDDIGHIYLIDRLKSIFKYLMHQVSPSEIEKVIGEHPAVLSVGVIGAPNPETTSAARAYVVLKPGNELTEDDIKKHVEGKTAFYKHLHGGVVFVDKLPETRGGKLDRMDLLQRAIKEMMASS